MTRPVGVALLCLLAVGCVDLSTDNSPVATWEGELSPNLAYPDLAGHVAAAVQVGGTDVGISITGATPAAQHLWGLWSGSCQTPGARFGTNDDYPILAVSDSGKASAETRLRAQLSKDSTYHAELRLSATDSTRIACGNLTKL